MRILCEKTCLKNERFTFRVTHALIVLELNCTRFINIYQPILCSTIIHFALAMVCVVCIARNFICRTLQKLPLCMALHVN